MGKYSSGRGGRAAFKAKQKARARASIKKHGTASYHYGGTVLTPTQQEAAVEKHEEKKPEAPTYIYKGKTYTSEAAVKEAIKAETIKKLPEPIKKRYEAARVAEVKRVAERKVREPVITKAPPLTMRPEDVMPRQDILTEEDISKADIAAQLRMKERLISEPTVEKIAEFGAKIPFSPIEIYFPTKIKEKIIPYKEEFIKGMIPVTREEMAKAALTAGVSFGIGAATPPAVAGIRYAGVRYIAPILAKVPKIKRVAEVGVGIGGKGITYGLGGYYVGATGLEVGKAELERPTAGARVLGKKVVTEVAPFLIGAKAGERLARRTVLKIGMEKEIQKIPPKKIKEFRAEFRKTRELRGIEPKEIPLGIVRKPPKKVPVKAEKIARKIIKERGAVVAGTLVHRAYYPKKFKAKFPRDIDVFYGKERPFVFKKKTPKKLAKEIAAELRKAEVPGVRRFGAEVRLKDYGKFVEVHPEAFETKAFARKAFPYYERPKVTPKGLKIISAREQARRKLAGVFLAKRTKDVPSYEELMAGTRIAAKEKKPFLKVFKTYELEVKPPRRPPAVREIPKPIKVIKEPKPLEPTPSYEPPALYKPKYRPRAYRPTAYAPYKAPPYKAPVAPIYKPTPYKPPKKVPPYKAPPYRPPRVPPYRVPPPYRPTKYPPTKPPTKYPPSPPYKPPKTPPTLVPPFKVPPLKEFKQLTKHKELFKGIKGFPQPKKYFPSFTAVVLGIKGIPKGLLGKGKVFMGLEVRPIPKYPKKKKRR